MYGSPTIGMPSGKNWRISIDFQDSHREEAEQLRKDPSLVDNQQFLKTHPALQTYLQEHPAVREELKQNPRAFMRLGRSL